MKKLLIILVSLIAGCKSAPPIDTLSKQYLYDNSGVSTSEFDRNITIQAIPINDTLTRGLTLDIFTYYLESKVNKETQSVSHSLVFGIKYHQDWRYYDSLNFSGGETINSYVIKRDVESCSTNMFTGCTFHEIVSFTILEAELKEAIKNGGLKFRINSRFKNIFTIGLFPPNYIEAQLQHVREKQSEASIKNS
ncbi:hypothetical protein GBO14_00560 [Pseudoalteromonas shioyasakiensis]|uniref:hypothetical protein n=1 Tax=Pseudoalteromonas shioyasakiensis TaxID=1190813 RepID=UPI0020953AB1|nr:hypothetical protein [Pseudoalteromonas shioyasakiensis]MCO6353261.1 hypothetical protein [Pseudoalteromonas shioyasakiensis]